MTLFKRRILCAARSELKLLADSLEPGTCTFFCNVHMLMLSRGDKALAEAMDNADYVFPDGVPVAWLQRRLGWMDAAVMRGYEVMERLCLKAVGTGQSIGLFGASDEVLSRLSETLESRFPGLRVVFQLAPGLVEEDGPIEAETVAAINRAAPDFLFVGLGCPKQEKWIHRHRQHVACAMLGVGAAFGWLAGTVPKPPKWMERVGLAWLYRLVREPRRMAKRYFVYNTQFVLASAKLLLFGPKPPIDTPRR